MGPEELGRQLRRARQHRGLSLRDVHAITAIPLPCLAALEEGDLAQLPSPVYARGYVRSYAEAVRLDGDRLALELWRSLEEPRPAVPSGARTAVDRHGAAGAATRPGSQPRKAAPPRPEPSSLAPLRKPASPFVPKEGRVRMPKPPRILRPKHGRIMKKSSRRAKRADGRLRKVAPVLERAAIVVLVLVLAAGLWSLVRGTPSDETKTTTRASQVDETKTSKPTSTSTPSTVPAPPPPAASPAADNGTQATYALARDRFTVTVAAKDAPLWIQVRAGQRGAQLFTGTLQPGEAKPFDSTGVVWVRVGNLAHAAVAVDGTPLTLPAKPAIPYNLLLHK